MAELDAICDMISSLLLAGDKMKIDDWLTSAFTAHTDPDGPGAIVVCESWGQGSRFQWHFSIYLRQGCPESVCELFKKVMQNAVPNHVSSVCYAIHRCQTEENQIGELKVFS